MLLCEPQTFMNLSGEAVGALLKYYQLPRKQLLVVVDDADLPLGEIRLRPGGSSGGIMGWSPSNNIWVRASMRGCGSALDGRTRGGKLPGTSWAGWTGGNWR